MTPVSLILHIYIQTTIESINEKIKRYKIDLDNECHMRKSYPKQIRAIQRSEMRGTNHVSLQVCKYAMHSRAEKYHYVQ